MHGDMPLMLRWSYRALVLDSERPQLVRNYVCVFMYHQCSESLLTLVRVKGADMFFISRTGQLSSLFSFTCQQHWTYQPHCHTSLKTQHRLIKSLLAPYQQQQRDGQGIVCSRAIDVGAPQHTAIEMWLALGSLTVTYEWSLTNCWTWLTKKNRSTKTPIKSLKWRIFVNMSLWLDSRLLKMEVLYMEMTVIVIQ